MDKNAIKSKEIPFNASLFSHGRLLERFTGSDACRFSPKKAYSILNFTNSKKMDVIWDPFCGSGLIVALARLFFGEQFDHFVVSDLQEAAVACAYKNLQLCDTSKFALQRLNTLRGLQKKNLKSYKRWGEVADYLESLLPYYEEKSNKNLAYFNCSAESLPKGFSGASIHFISDLPYGKQSERLGNKSLCTLIDALLSYSCDIRLSLIVSTEQADQITLTTMEKIPYKGGRTLLHFNG